MVGGVAVFRTDNAMDMTMSSDDDEDEMQEAGLPVVVVIKSEVEVARGCIDC